MIIIVLGWNIRNRSDSGLEARGGAHDDVVPM